MTKSIAIVILTCRVMLSAQLSNSLERALLREDWAAVEKLAVVAPSSTTALLRAHALLALNRTGAASCIFMGSNDIVQWQSWATAFVAVHPNSATAHYLAGDAHARLKHWASALESFDRALSLTPDHHLAQNARGVVYAVLRQKDAALEDLNRVAKLHPAFADAFANRGFLYVQDSGPFAGAQRAFKTAMELAPDLALVQGLLGELDMMGGDFEQGNRTVRRAAAKSVCAGPLLAQDLLALSGWFERQEGMQMAGPKPADIGMTVHRELTEALKGKGNSDAVARVVEAAARSNDPKVLRQTSMTLKEAAGRDTNLGKAIGEGVNKFVDRNQRANTALDIAKAITGTAEIGSGNTSVKAQVGKNFKVEVQQSINAKIGIGVNMAKALEPVQKGIQDRLTIGKEMQKAIPAANVEQGGVTTSMHSARTIRQGWPQVPHYTLAYTAIDQEGVSNVK